MTEELSRTAKPLDGVRVLDLTRMVAGGIAGMLLGDFGADVVKVEQPPAGDRIRMIPPFGPGGLSPHHMGQNWGKRSIGLDLRDEADRSVCLELAEQADVIWKTSWPASGRASISKRCGRHGRL